MPIHYVNESATGEYLLLSAQLEHDGGCSLELRDGRWVVEGVAQIDTFARATELLAEVA